MATWVRAQNRARPNRRRRPTASDSSFDADLLVLQVDAAPVLARGRRAGPPPAPRPRRTTVQKVMAAMRLGLRWLYN